MMDWNALGTWAAVVVALGLSVRDIIERRRARTARHLVTAAQIYPHIARLRNALAEVVEESSVLGAIDDTELILQAIDAYAARLQGMGLHHLREKADQIDALPEDMLIPFVKALSVSDMLLENYSLRKLHDENPGLGTVRSELEEWSEQCRSMKVSLDWVIEGAEKHMKSLRWRNPERWL